jgi:hypothetical protein
MQGLAVGTGVVAVALAGVQTLEQNYSGVRIGLWILAAASAVGVVLMVSPSVARLVLRRLAPAQQDRTPRVITVIVAIGVNLLAWAGVWGGVLAAGQGPASQRRHSAALSVGAFAASYLAGLLFLVAPGGLVVRESVLTLMLPGRHWPGPRGSPRGRVAVDADDY